MPTMDRDYLSTTLLRLLSETGVTQTDLADYAGIKQGHLNDHLRKKSYPKVHLLIKYAMFFSRKTGRKITLFELTNDEVYKDMPAILENPGPEDISAQANWAESAFRALPEGHWKRKAIEALLSQTDENGK